METGLKPCPFCGEEPYTRMVFKSPGCGPYPAEVDLIVRCPECGCFRSVVLKLSDMSFEKVIIEIQNAVAAWNRRTEDGK